MPVFSRPCGSFSSFRRADSVTAGGSPARPAGVTVEADVDLAIEKRARGQDHAARSKRMPTCVTAPAIPVAFHDQVVARPLEEPEVRLVLQAAPDRRLVEDPVGLGARRPHRRALGAVQDAEVDAGFVGRRRHRAAQRVDLLDQVALADAADRRVAAHLPQGLDVVRQQQRRRAHARRGERGLGAGVAAADDDHVEFLEETASRPFCAAGTIVFFPSRIERKAGPRRGQATAGRARRRAASRCAVMPSSRYGAPTATKPSPGVERARAATAPRCGRHARPGLRRSARSRGAPARGRARRHARSGVVMTRPIDGSAYFCPGSSRRA